VVRIGSQIPPSSTQPPVGEIGELNGHLTIEPKRNFDQQTLAVRIPPWCDDHSIVVTAKGDQILVVVGNDYLWLNNLRSGTGIQITFPQPHFLTQERVLGYEKPYHVRWLGNTVVAMSGGGRRMDLYPELEN
jgi:hypothetical protein